ncbi:MAG: VCBS repeat-containing protein [Bacteroidota bacterium]
MSKVVRIVFLIHFCFLSCKDAPYSGTSSTPVVTSIDGESLSKTYCIACHQYPQPDLLDKDTWQNYILPRMGYMYGIYENEQQREELFENNVGGEIVQARNLFPKERTLDSLSWKAIVDYYVSYAPVELSLTERKVISKDQTQFEVIIPQQKMKIPSSTMAQFSENGTIYLGDAMTRSFSEFSKDLELLKTGNVQEGAVSLHDDGEAIWLTVMGSFSPTDAPEGLVAVLPKNGKANGWVPISNLQRPVHSSYGDLDNDGDTDIVVAEFGKWTGALSLFENEDGAYNKEVLHPTPGAIKSYIRDMNNDGHPDIVALFAQGDEGIDIFYNDGAANFSRDRVLSFSPSMGGSFMNLIDYNQDGFMDIIYTAGDNADYKPIMKPWHGVYVFTNDGNNNFIETLFLHLNGAYNAIADDFDADGDMDIAAISFFPDWVHSPEESFVYFQNNGKENFSMSTFPEVNKGRWVVMDGSDYDNDGDMDLILGSLAFEVVPKLGYVEQWMEEGIPFIILKNTQR